MIKVTPSAIQAWRRARSLGETLHAIANVWDVSPSTVLRHTSKAAYERERRYEEKRNVRRRKKKRPAAA